MIWDGLLTPQSSKSASGGPFLVDDNRGSCCGPCMKQLWRRASLGFVDPGVNGQCCVTLLALTDDLRCRATYSIAAWVPCARKCQLRAEEEGRFVITDDTGGARRKLEPPSPRSTSWTELTPTFPSELIPDQTNGQNTEFEDCPCFRSTSHDTSQHPASRFICV